MHRTMLRSKIHRATVTGADPEYIGSVSIDPALLDAAGISEYEQVHVLDLDNGARLTTYAIEGTGGEICLNGAAAHLIQPGHRVIILTYCSVDDAEFANHTPTVIHVDTSNRAVDQATARALAGERRYVTVNG